MKVESPVLRPVTKVPNIQPRPSTVAPAPPRQVEAKPVVPPGVGRNVDTLA